MLIHQCRKFAAEITIYVIFQIQISKLYSFDLNNLGGWILAPLGIDFELPWTLDFNSLEVGVFSCLGNWILSVQKF